jgi:hypothetical protein
MGKSEQNNTLEYCVKWVGCKSSRGTIIQGDKYTWESKVPRELILKYEEMGPSIKWSDHVEQLRPFQHENQKAIEAREIKDLSAYQKIELLVDSKKYEFYKMPRRFKYKGIVRELRHQYYMCRMGVVWNNTNKQYLG